jgi:hypothetical protein
MNPRKWTGVPLTARLLSEQGTLWAAGGRYLREGRSAGGWLLPQAGPALRSAARASFIVAGRNGGVSITMSTSIGLFSNQCRRSGTIESMMARLAANTAHMHQSRTAARISRIRPGRTPVRLWSEWLAARRRSAAPAAILSCARRAKWLACPPWGHPALASSRHTLSSSPSTPAEPDLPYFSSRYRTAAKL